MLAIVVLDFESQVVLAAFPVFAQKERQLTEDLDLVAVDFENQVAVFEAGAFGALERGPDGRYGVGVRLLELAALAPRGLQLREAAFPYVDALRQRTGGNVHLGVRDGSEVVFVDALRTVAAGMSIPVARACSTIARYSAALAWSARAS